MRKASAERRASKACVIRPATGAGTARGPYFPPRAELGGADGAPLRKLADPALVGLDLADLAGICEQLEGLSFTELDGTRRFEVVNEVCIG
jgi:hypothetical protein